MNTFNYSHVVHVFSRDLVLTQLEESVLGLLERNFDDFDIQHSTRVRIAQIAYQKAISNDDLNSLTNALLSKLQGALGYFDTHSVDLENHDSRNDFYAKRRVITSLILDISIYSIILHLLEIDTLTVYLD